MLFNFLKVKYFSLENASRNLNRLSIQIWISKSTCQVLGYIFVSFIFAENAETLNCITYFHMRCNCVHFLYGIACYYVSGFVIKYPLLVHLSHVNQNQTSSSVDNYFGYVLHHMMCILSITKFHFFRWYCFSY